jgi:hypothetical protein
LLVNSFSWDGDEGAAYDDAAFELFLAWSDVPKPGEVDETLEALGKVNKGVGRG